MTPPGDAPESPSELPFGWVDLCWVVETALSRGGALLTAGEAVVARRLLALPPDAGALYARLTQRTSDVQRVDSCVTDALPDPTAALDALRAAGLVGGPVRSAERLDALTVDELRAYARVRGRPTSGARAELLATLADVGRDAPIDVFRVLHRRLVRRLERFALLRRHPERGALVVARLGHVRWPEYALTPTGPLFPTRAALIAWEEVVDRPPSVDAAFTALGRPAPPGRLDPRPSLRRRLAERAAELERDGAHADAALLWSRLVDAGQVDPAEAAVRRARCEELAGDAIAAHRILREARASAAGATRLAVERALRRVARAVGASFAPSPPLRSAPERHSSWGAGGRRHRPTFRAGDADRWVEDRVADAIRAAGRAVIRGEGPLWTTLFVWAFHEAMFAPVPGMLPSPHQSGPLDVGTAAFAPRRARWVQPAIRRLRAGDGPALIREGAARFAGRSVAGASPHVDVATAASLVEGLGGDGVTAVLEPLLVFGWAEAAGLPDWVVLAGDAVQVDARPSRLDGAARFVEVKGPGDSLSDAQRVWLDRLLGAGLAAEVWHVAARAAQTAVTESRPLV